MQTFLPYIDFKQSAEALDRQRLGKQRVENMQLMSAITGVKIDPDTNKLIRPVKVGWANHPAALMWKDYPTGLMEYQRAICTEWVARGYKDTCLEKTERIYKVSIGHGLISTSPIVPAWLDDDFCLAHRSNLIRKSEDYRKLWGLEFPDDLPYKWGK